jgi:shikimate dehydrogenase
VYLALPVAAADLAQALTGLEAIGCAGLNVTLPHKAAAADLAAERSTLVERLGAANTLVRRPQGGWRAENTDVAGFRAPLEAMGSWAGRPATVLGCGGSARAVVAALAALGCDPIVVLGRRPEALEALQRACAAWAPTLRPTPWGRDPGSLLAGSDLVVNTTPVGMAAAGAAPGRGDCPLPERDLDRLPPQATVYDLIYTPRPTVLLREAAARGCRTLDGLEMLVQQGAASLRLWTGRSDVPDGCMRQAALGGLLPTPGHGPRV